MFNTDYIFICQNYARLINIFVIINDSKFITWVNLLLKKKVNEYIA